MKTKLSLFVMLFSSILPLRLCAAEDADVKMEIGQGYRNDSLRWSIGDKYIPSELDYKNIKVRLTTLRTTLSKGPYIGVIEAAYGNIFGGRNRDSDYDSRNRRDEWSRSRATITGDFSIDASAKIGRIFPLPSGSSFTSSIGYGAFWQHLRVKHGYITIYNYQHFHKNQLPLNHLNDTYKARWTAPFLDFQFSFPILSRLSLDLGYSVYCPVHYSGTGHWKLRHMHFTQNNRPFKSYGQKANLGLRWACTDKVEIGISSSIAQFDAKKGTDKWTENRSSGHGPFHRAERKFVDAVLTLSYAL